MIRQPASAAACTTRLPACAKQTSRPSTPCEHSSTRVSSSAAGARTTSTPMGSSTSRVTSRLSKTWSVTMTRATGSGQRLVRERVLGEDHRPVLGDEEVLLEADGLLEAGVAGERLGGEVHALLELDGVVERVGA